MTTAALADTVRAERRGDIGVITLDRVTALNALNTEMVDTLDMVLAEWENAGLRAVVLDSASPKAFCAGGDIRAVRQNSLAGDPEASERFFATEYRLKRPHRRLPGPVHFAHRRHLHGRRDGPVDSRDLPIDETPQYRHLGDPQRRHHTRAGASRCFRQRRAMRTGRR
ncbi:Enoyl-CoA hydratase/isomerase [Rhodococcus koreensis]|uniref:3-hydroxyisobutyryl-CoA hydrolase n=1 Tax=Rhodococcus koreensis TaxID=99653 RepID=A0A1H4W8W9_9NOCA|nr:Enoyl-CoA hydratase/isomerase [Rhodococcus koreensis]